VLVRLLQRRERAFGVDAEHTVIIRLGEVDGRLIDHFDAGVRDDDVELAEALDRRREQPVDVGAPYGGGWRHREERQPARSCSSRIVG